MNKTYCDKCGKDKTNHGSTARVELMGRPGMYAFKDLCGDCTRLFTEHLDKFIPGFLPKPEPVKVKKWVWGR